ncbi:MAG: class I SAM-dependent methyltransferase [Bdellovibrionales bacterium]
MSDSAQTFYDNLAGSYHLIGMEWDQVMREQGQTLDTLLRRHSGKAACLRVLDCSCGIGTQAIGLALRGHHVYASDLSRKAVEQARSNATRLGVHMDFRVADFRDLSRISGVYDAVISCDNSLPHLENETEMQAALQQIHSKLVPGGVSLFSIRDYDRIVQEKPPGVMPRILEDHAGKRIYFQTWEWHPDHPTYDVTLFIVCQLHTEWRTKAFSTRYRAWKKSELTDLMSRSGFTETHWLEPNESGYYQPILVGRK